MLNINRLINEVNGDDRTIKQLEFEIDSTSCNKYKLQLKLMVRKKLIIDKYTNLNDNQKLQWDLYDKYRSNLIKEAVSGVKTPKFNCVIFEEVDSYIDTFNYNPYFVFDLDKNIRKFLCIKLKNLDVFRYIENKNSLIFFLNS